MKTFDADRPAHTPGSAVFRSLARWRTVLAACASALVLAACSLSPGVHMGSPDNVSRALTEDGAPADALKPITAELIRSLDEDDARTAGANCSLCSEPPNPTGSVRAIS